MYHGQNEIVPSLPTWSRCLFTPAYKRTEFSYNIPVGNGVGKFFIKDILAKHYLSSFWSTCFDNATILSPLRFQVEQGVPAGGRHEEPTNDIPQHHDVLHLSSTSVPQIKLVTLTKLNRISVLNVSSFCHISLASLECDMRI